MSIECDKSFFDDDVLCYTPVCDYCGDVLTMKFDFMDAVRAKKDAGWRSIRDQYGDWTDACPECAEKFFPKRETAMNDFAGVGKQ